MSQALVVLGRGINSDGTLSASSLANVRKAVELYQRHHAPHIIMSGKWSYHLNHPPAQTEAAAMKTYAITLGIDDSAILCEDESLDTIGNLYFTKKRLVEPRQWQTLTIVAAIEHIERVKFLCEKIYGSGYTFDYYAADSVLNHQQYTKELNHEKASLEFAHRHLQGVEDGDDKTIGKLLEKHYRAHTMHKP